jgi:hypothetical protein
LPWHFRCRTWILLEPAGHDADDQPRFVETYRDARGKFFDA